MKERYRTMMEQMELSENIRTAIEESLAKNSKVRRNNFLRIALAAACICLILTGGVFAAGQLARVFISQSQSSEEHSEFHVSIDPLLYDKNALQQQPDKQFSTSGCFSDKLTNDLENDTLQRAFMDRAELEEYLGFSLIHSETLESASINEHLEQDFAYNWNLRPELAVAPDARYVLTATTYDNAEMTGFPEVLKITMHRVVENFEVYMDARIVTGSVDGQIELIGEEFEPEPLLDHKLLVDENGYLILDEHGNAIMETVQYESAEKIFSYESYVMANGLEAIIVTIETPDPTLERAKEAGIHTEGHGFRDYIGYFVHNDILYSIMPYAIYDNTIPGNYVNGTELTILKHILDSFA